MARESFCAAKALSASRQNRGSTLLCLQEVLQEQLSPFQEKARALFKSFGYIETLKSLKWGIENLNKSKYLNKEVG